MTTPRARSQQRGCCGCLGACTVRVPRPHASCGAQARQRAARLRMRARVRRSPSSSRAYWWPRPRCASGLRRRRSR
eukprot:248995-Chlamydomonas_euryale.AAC.1